MILLNFSHPITPEQLAQVEVLTNNVVDKTIAVPIHFNQDAPFLPQLREALEPLAFSPQEWQTLPIVVNLPSFNYISALTLAELHGRMGYFPPILRLRPVEGALPPRYEVVEVINLQAVRDEARKTRYQG